MKMNAKAALLGAYGTNVGTPSGLDGPGIAVLVLTARPGGHLPRRDGQSGVRADHGAAAAVFPTKTGDAVLVNQDELLKRYPGAIGGKTGFTDIARKTFVGAAQRDGRRLVVALMFGLDKDRRPDLLGPGGEPCWTGASRSTASASIGSL